MLFNSFEFAVFLPVVFAIYWLLKRVGRTGQNVFLVLASYVFYGWWDYRFLSLIIFSSALDFSIGQRLGKESSSGSRKALLWTSVLVNLGFLGFFKYYNFFAASFAEAFTLFGTRFEVDRLNIILPVGISFYTFQTLSYTMDVYKKKLAPSTDVVSFFAFVSFFPQLVAGPIERAKNLLPQFHGEREFDEDAARDGLRQILWGLFKKVVVADNCAVVANAVFENFDSQPPSMLLIGALFFSFQIYGDFSGYSDIAIGTARLFGFDLMRNFAYPYFSRDIAEFWRRWHISLSSWFKDYLYIPLGGSRGSSTKKIRNIFLIFLVSGFWHGANWTFIFWGLVNALLFLPLLLTARNRRNTSIVAEDSVLPSLREAVSIAFTFSVTVLAWIFFRSNSVSEAFAFIERLITGVFSDLQQISIMLDLLSHELTMLYIVIMLVVEWFSRKKEHGLESVFGIRWTALRWLVYIVLIILILSQEEKEIDFIYFQF